MFSPLVITWCGFLFSLGCLLFFANRFLSSALDLARVWALPPALVGVTVVAFGTSAPELFTSVIASFRGSSGIALGNALGSNLGNFGLAIGLSALLRPLRIDAATVRFHLPVLLCSMAAAFLFLWDGKLGRGDAGVLLLGFVPALWFLFRDGGEDRRTGGDSDSGRRLLSTLMFAVYTFLLFVSGWLLVGAAKKLAYLLGLDEIAIGLIPVAIGTSLPEILVTVLATWRGAYGIAVGNVVGSNIFNILGVIGFAGIIAPLQVSDRLVFLQRDFGFTFLFTAVFCLYCLIFRLRGKDSRALSAGMGALLVGGYFAYCYKMFF